jgi:hypothetical protein
MKSPEFYGTYCILQYSPLIPVLSQTNPIHTTPSFSIEPIEADENLLLYSLGYDFTSNCSSVVTPMSVITIDVYGTIA